MKPYNSLFRRYPEQDLRDVFAHFPYNGTIGDNWETPFKSLVELAKKENWNFSKTEFQKPTMQYPILTNYLNYTFLRVQDLGFIEYSEDKTKACFNTGLQTPEEKDIFATFFLNKEAEQRGFPDWTFYTFAESYSDKLSYYNTLPEIAHYISDPNDLVFDHRLGDIDINHRHIWQNKTRLPVDLQNNERMAKNCIDGAVKSLRSRILRNYKLAIPHWYEGKIQLLLPLCLINDTLADVALVVDKVINTYKARTILTMDKAYINARLIARPDRDWLDP